MMGDANVASTGAVAGNAVEPWNWKSNVCVIVTGASKGLGKAICTGFANSFVQKSKENAEAKMSFVLMSRDSGALDEVQRMVDAIDPKIHVIDVISGALEDNNTIKSFEAAVETFGKLGPKYNQAILVHNAGSLGDPKKLVQTYSSEDSAFLTTYFEINLISSIKMTGAFLRAFTATKQRTVINISSLCALSALKGLNVYGTAKSARDAYFRSVALEDPSTLVLNFAPGPLDTQMAATLKKDSYLQEFFEDKNNILKPEQAVQRLLQILESGKFKSGSHVDYFDKNL